MAEIRFEKEYYLPGGEIKVIYSDIYRLGYYMEVRDSENEKLFGGIAMMGGGEHSYKLLPWAKTGRYKVELFDGNDALQDSDTTVVGIVTKKQITFLSVPIGAKIEVRK